MFYYELYKRIKARINTIGGLYLYYLGVFNNNEYYFYSLYH